LNGSFGTYGCADAAPFAIVEINQNTPGLLIPCDTEIRAEEAADLAGLTLAYTQAALSLLDRFFFLKAEFNGSKPLYPFTGRKHPWF